MIRKKYKIYLFNLEKDGERSAYEELMTKVISSPKRYELKEHTYFDKTFRQKSKSPDGAEDEMSITETWVRVVLIISYDPELERLKELEKELEKNLAKPDEESDESVPEASE